MVTHYPRPSSSLPYPAGPQVRQERERRWKLALNVSPCSGVSSSHFMNSCKLLSALHIHLLTRTFRVLNLSAGTGLGTWPVLAQFWRPPALRRPMRMDARGNGNLDVSVFRPHFTIFWCLHLALPAPYNVIVQREDQSDLRVWVETLILMPIVGLCGVPLVCVWPVLAPPISRRSASLFHRRPVRFRFYHIALFFFFTPSAPITRTSGQCSLPALRLSCF